MTSQWQGSIAVGDGRYIRGITIGTPAKPCPYLPLESSLRFLSVVETTRIPLFLVIGEAHQVTSSDEEAERWLSSILLNGNHDHNDKLCPWWQIARADSPLAILVAIDHAIGSKTKATELLLYATQDSDLGNGCSPVLRVYAQPLCSDLLNTSIVKEPSPPASPLPEDREIEGVFLPLDTTNTTEEGEVINLPPVRKRKTVDETFDEAAERRRKARRKGGEGVAAAAASRNPPDVALRQTSSHRRSTSNSQSFPLQTRPLSRASSVGSSRVADLREPSVPALSKRSSLGRVQSVASAAAHALPEENSSIEQSNKETISKVVMAGMRLYGLVQSKTRKSRADSNAASPAIDASFETLDVERQKDEEYKLIYYQIYKGTCFALRQHLAIKSLQGRTEALRETVDKLLTIFCNDPLMLEDHDAGDEFTPGGRKAFGSSTVTTSVNLNPFLSVSQVSSQNNTPSGGRKFGGRVGGG